MIDIHQEDVLKHCNYYRSVVLLRCNIIVILKNNYVVIFMTMMRLMDDLSMKAARGVYDEFAYDMTLSTNENCSSTTYIRRSSVVYWH